MRKNSPVLVAHRGASGLAPENTLAAIRKALAIGVDAIEIDVHRSRDGAIVLMHDATLERTGGVDGVLAEKSLEDLKRVDAGSWFGSEFAGETIPTLTEALSITKGKAVLLIEIKPDNITEDVLRVVSEQQAENWVIVMSFHSEVVRRAREAAPNLATGLIVGAPYREDSAQHAWELVHRTAGTGASVLSLSYPAIDPTLAYEVRRRGLSLWSWTVDDPSKMQELSEWGVDGIITNFPDRRQVLE